MHAEYMDDKCKTSKLRKVYREQVDLKIYEYKRHNCLKKRMNIEIVGIDIGIGFMVTLIRSV